jgi:hypothetical protein
MSPIPATHTTATATAADTATAAIRAADPGLNSSPLDLDVTQVRRRRIAAGIAGFRALEPAHE